jgi:hypothetical protein
MADQFIQQQVAEFLRRNPTQANIPAKVAPAKAAVATKNAEPAPKNGEVVQLQCTKFSEKGSSSDSDSDSDSHSDDDSEYDNSDFYGSCACDEEGMCDYHLMKQAISEYFKKNTRALVSTKK